MKTQSAFITGATAGIGKATALALARLGWHVCVHGRKSASCQTTVADIKKSTGNESIDFVTADLSDLSQVHALADRVTFQAPQLNILVLNAGTFAPQRHRTVDGWERTWAVNYLSRFLLTHLLLDHLAQNGPSRIIDVSGAYHAKGKIHWNDITLARGYSMSQANNQSKLANVLFTYRMDRYLQGSPVTINTLHPGAVNTGAVLRTAGLSGFTKTMYRLMSPFFKSPERGAATSIYLASSPEVEGISGKYFVNQKPRQSTAVSYDLPLQERLWFRSQEMIEDSLGLSLAQVKV
ncbi:MAG TPA: short-chain dehydrogenase [Cytophagales bacterium]|nr:short-chain dehydrogenase [Cytophagales bacterium]HAP59884.1 short-chain dehydrogenase [Cytophagales bacterium]